MTLREKAARQPEILRERFTGSAAEHLWGRLNEMDFINRGMLFAAVLLLCFIPFSIVVRALAGRGAETSIARRFGLNPQAAHDVSRVLTSPHNTSAAISGLGYVLFVLGGIAAATAIQDLYERSFGLPGRGLRDTPRRVAWLAVFMAATALVGWLQPSLHDRGGPLAFGLVTLVGATAFWWFTMWFLLGGRLPWRRLFPSAAATGVAWLGMTIVFRLTMSDSVVSNFNKYGAIGVVFSIMSYLIAVGVVVILGAVFGVVWHERRSGLGYSKQADRKGSNHGTTEPVDDPRGGRGAAAGTAGAPRP